MRIGRLLFGLAALPFVLGCAVTSVSVSSVQPGARPVTAETSVFNFLGLNRTSVEEVAELRDSLNEQCGDGGVTGVVTMSSTIYVIIGVIERTELSGYCVE